MKGQSQILRSRKGQGTVEYLLVLSVVLILLGMLRQFNESFRSFVQNYYENYLTCLMETGELPSLGNSNSESECDAEFQPFTFAAGRPPRTDVPGGSDRPGSKNAVDTKTADASGKGGDDDGGGRGGGGGGSSTGATEGGSSGPSSGGGPSL